MDRHALFETAKRLWPDGVTLASKSSHEEALNNIYWRIEEQLSGRPDDWLQLAAWAFHQPLWG